MATVRRRRVGYSKYRAKPQFICLDCEVSHSSKRKHCGSCGSDRMHYFASKGEARRFYELRLAVRAGSITNLKLHPRFPLVVNGVHVTTYEADFQYTRHSGEVVVEDFKGVQTSEFKLKRKLLRAVHGVEIELVK